MSNDAKRIGYIDFAKGIVILLVIFGHLVPFDGRVFRIIFSFHMPFFFFVSGYCSSLYRKDIGFGKFLKRSFSRYIIPNICYSIWLILIKNVAVTSIRDGLYYIFVSPLHEWFLPAFFFANICFFMYIKLYRFLEKKHMEGIGTLFIISIIFPVIVFLSERGWHDYPYFPIKVLSSLSGFLFIIIGFWVRNRLSIMVDWEIAWNNKFIYIALSFVLGIMALKNTYLNMANIAFGRSDILYIFTATFYSCCVLLCAQLIERKKIKLISVIELLGRNTLLVYLAHGTIFYFLGLIFSKYTGIVFTPMIDFPWKMVVIYFVIASVLSLILCWLCERIECGLRSRG